MSSKHSMAMQMFMQAASPSRDPRPAPKGKSFDKAYQDQKPAGYNIERVSSGAGKDGLKVSHKRVPYYDIVKPKTTTVVQQAPAPKAAPKPVEKQIEPGTFKVSPEIQQAKDRVNAYENTSSKAWDQAQATVQSSFIKPSESSTDTKEYDFSADSFNANESPEPNEQAQAAQNQVQNYVSKYSQYKSNT